MLLVMHMFASANTPEGSSEDYGEINADETHSDNCVRGKTQFGYKNVPHSSSSSKYALAKRTLPQNREKSSFCSAPGKKTFSLAASSAQGHPSLPTEAHTIYHTLPHVTATSTPRLRKCPAREGKAPFPNPAHANWQLTSGLTSW